MGGGKGGPFGPPRDLDGGFPEGRGHGGPGHGGPGGPGGRPPPFAVDSAAITACRDALTACTAVAGADEAACRDTEHSCVRDAFRAAFKAKCDEATAACTDPAANATACAAITERCTQGVDGIPPGADGGVCQ